MRNFFVKVKSDSRKTAGQLTGNQWLQIFVYMLEKGESKHVYTIDCSVMNDGQLAVTVQDVAEPNKIYQTITER